MHEALTLTLKSRSVKTGKGIQKRLTYYSGTNNTTDSQLLYIVSVIDVSNKDVMSKDTIETSLNKRN